MTSKQKPTLIEKLNETGHVRWQNVIAGDLPPLDFVFDGLLAGTVGGIVAPGGAGKSFLGLSICAALSANSNMIELQNVTKTYEKTMYVTAEDPQTILEWRLHHLTKALDSEQQKVLTENFMAQSIHGIQAAILDASNQVNQEFINWLVSQASGKRLLIIDTLRKFHQAEENDSGAMTLLTQILDYIAATTGCSILFLHHANKAATMTGQGGNQGAARGSSALTDNIRFQMNMQSMTQEEAETLGVNDDCRKNFVKLISSKSNYAESSGTHWLRRCDGGVLVKAAPFDSLAIIEKSKERDFIANNSDAKDRQGMGYKDIFGG